MWPWPCQTDHGLAAMSYAINQVSHRHFAMIDFFMHYCPQRSNNAKLWKIKFNSKFIALTLIFACCAPRECPRQVSDADSAERWLLPAPILNVITATIVHRYGGSSLRPGLRCRSFRVVRSNNRACCPVAITGTTILMPYLRVWSLQLADTYLTTGWDAMIKALAMTVGHLNQYKNVVLPI